MSEREGYKPDDNRHTENKPSSDAERQKMGRGYHFRVQPPEVRRSGPGLERNQRDYLLFMARGGKNADAAALFDTSIPTLVRLTADINARLETNDLSHAIATAITNGDIPADEVLEGFDLSKLANLSLDSNLLLNDLVEGGSKETSYQAIAERYKISKRSIDGRYRRLFQKIGTKNKEHTIGVLAAINKKREQSAKMAE